MEADVPMDDWEQIGILSGHRGLVLALAVYKDRLISGSGSVWQVVASARVMAPLLTPASWGGLSRFLAAADQGPMGGCGAALRPGRSHRSSGFRRQVPTTVAFACGAWAVPAHRSAATGSVSARSRDTTAASSASASFRVCRRPARPAKAAVPLARRATRPSHHGRGSARPAREVGP